MTGPGPPAREEIYAGRILTLSRDTVVLPGGTAATFEHISHPGAAAVLPFLDPPEAGNPRVVLIRQYRHSAGGRLYEIPAGLPASPAEGWEACARRELAEETGYEAGEMRYLTGLLTTPGFTDERIHLFAGTRLVAGSARRERDEVIEVVDLPLSEAVEGVRSGRIADAKTAAALLFVQAFPPGAREAERSPPPR